MLVWRCHASVAERGPTVVLWITNTCSPQAIRGWLDRVPHATDIADLPGVTTSAHALFVWLSPTTAVEFRTGSGHRTAHLRFGRSGIGADVSIQPGAVVTTIDDQAHLVGGDRNRWQLVVSSALANWAADSAWVPAGSATLTHAIGAFTHPLLATIYRDGCEPLSEIPRWASPTLRAATAHEAARTLLDGHGNRRLTRVLANSLTPRDGRPDLSGLGLCVAAVGLVNVDELANIVEASTTSASRYTPTQEEVRSLRDGLVLYPEARRARLLVDIARRGAHAEASTLMLRLGWIINRAPSPLPTRLDELEALCLRLVPVVSDTAPMPSAISPPRRPTRAQRPAVVTAADTPHPTAVGAPNQPSFFVPEPTAPVPAPQPVRRSHSRRIGTTARVAPSAPVSHAWSWPIPQPLVGIARHRQDGLDFDVPTSVATLRQWGAQLRNCLDTFAAAAAHQRSWLIGIRRGDTLVGCIELCPTTRGIRQALGPANQRLANDVYDTAILALTNFDLLGSR